MLYDAEHFFDGYADDPAYAIDCLRAAAGAGAETVVCCDTNGGTLPDQIALVMDAVIGQLASESARVGIHCHDDAGCGVANSLAAVRRGRDSRARDDQRVRRALRQRQPGDDHPEPPAQAGLRVREPRRSSPR